MDTRKSLTFNGGVGDCEEVRVCSKVQWREVSGYEEEVVVCVEQICEAVELGSPTQAQSCWQPH